MSFRYENYGTADLLTIAGATVLLDRTQSKYYSGFYQTQRTKCFDIPACQELWIKSDIYTTSSYNRDSNSQRMRIYNDNATVGACGFATGVSSIHTYGLLQIFHNGTSQNKNNSFVKNSFNTILLHMKAGISDGVIEWTLQDGRTDSYNGNVNNGADFDNIYIQCDSNTILISNVIISDEKVAITENAKLSLQSAFATARIVKEAIPVKINADTQRKISKTIAAKISADTTRNVGAKIVRNYDTKIAKTISQKSTFDTKRAISKHIKYSFDTLKSYPWIINIDNSGVTAERRR